MYARNEAEAVRVRRDDQVISYIGIRADEDREGYIIKGNYRGRLSVYRGWNNERGRFSVDEESVGVLRTMNGVPDQAATFASFSDKASG